MFVHVPSCLCVSLICIHSYIQICYMHTYVYTHTWTCMYVHAHAHIYTNICHNLTLTNKGGATWVY